MLMECATGKYPFQECSSCIEMAQTILAADVPRLPRGQFSASFSDFLNQCLKLDPNSRLPAEVLLGSPWLQEWRITNPNEALNVTKQWIDSLVS